MTDLELIAYAEQHAQQDALLTRGEIIQLLSIEPAARHGGNWARPRAAFPAG